MTDDAAPDVRRTVAAGYDELVPRFAVWSSAVSDPARDRSFAEFVGRLPVGARVLDLGCGAGTSWTDGLATRFAITGVDLSPGQIEAARRNVPEATFLVADMTAVELEGHSFDGAVALYSIGHLPRDEHESVFARLARWLRPGGLLLASVPADEDEGSVRPWIDGVDMFFASLGAGRYDEILREQGWQVIDARVDVADEPGAEARFFWILAMAPGADGSPPEPWLQRSDG